VFDDFEDLAGDDGDIGFGVLVILLSRSITGVSAEGDWIFFVSLVRIGGIASGCVARSPRWI